MTSSVRIIAGRFRGRKISFEEAKGLRPTTDRIRETVFNWLMYDIPDATCLDAFSGTGVMGFEALSRGAKEVVCVEKNRAVFQEIQKNAAVIPAKAGIQVFNQDIQLYLKNTTQTFDIIFCDPPFNQGLLHTVLPHCLAHLNPDGLMYIEHEASLAPESFLPAGLEIKKQKKMGEVGVLLVAVLS